MRLTLIVLILFAWASSAAAQTDNEAIGFGPFRFGMTLAEAEAVTPNTHWAQDVLDDGRVSLSNGPLVEVGGARLRPALAFENDALDLIVLSARSPTRCAEVVPEFLSILEPIFGRFSAVAGSWERFGTKDESVDGRMTMFTEGGSEIRIYNYDTGRASYNSRMRSELDAQVVGNSLIGESAECRLLLRISKTEPYRGPATTLTYEELDQARTLSDPGWTQRPSNRDWERYFPRRALTNRAAGRVLLDCLVDVDYSPRCLVASDSYPAMGFGEAAMQISRSFRFTEQTEEGTDTRGMRFRIPFSFNTD